MDTAPALPLLLAELTSDVMSELSTTARLLWLLLSAMPAEEPVRLNVPRLRLHLHAAFDHGASRSDVELAVLTLEDLGLIVTSAGQDGRERFRIGQRPQVSRRARHEPSTAPEPAPSDSVTAPQSAFIGTVGRERERDESESASESSALPPRPALDGPPPPFCPDHMPLGSGGVPCVVCGDLHRAYDIWKARRAHPEWAEQPQPTVPTPPSWQRGRHQPGPQQPPLFDRRPRFHPTGEPAPDPDPDDLYPLLPY